jgi:hypothetical protein
MKRNRPAAKDIDKKSDDELRKEKRKQDALKPASSESRLSLPKINGKVLI